MTIKKVSGSNNAWYWNIDVTLQYFKNYYFYKMINACVINSEKDEDEKNRLSFWIVIWEII